MGEYGGHIPKRIATEPVTTPLINGHLPECVKAGWVGLMCQPYSCPKCLASYLEVTK